MDLLPAGGETVIGTDSALAETVDRVMRETSSAVLPAVDPPCRPGGASPV